MKRRIILTILLLIVILSSLGIRAVFAFKKAVETTNKAVGAAKLQDLDATKAYLKDAKGQFQSAKKSMVVFTPLRIVPFLGWYVADIQRGVDGAIYGLEAASTFTEAITPYADVLGLSGQGTFLGGTAQERLAKAIETLAKVTPQIDQVGQKLATAKTQLDQIQSWRYPNFLPGKPGAKIEAAKSTVSQLESFI